MTEYRNLLDTIIEGRELPEGCTSWAIRSVHPDLTSQHGYRYPWPGTWAEAPGPIIETNTDSCPIRIGDGICAASTWEQMAFGGIPAITLLLVAYGPADLISRDPQQKLRLRRMYIVDVINGQELLQAAGRANLSGAYLSGANLSGAYLSGAYLSGAYLSRANLSRANLSRANLSGANLSRANLSRANLSGANLSGANLSGAYLSGANLSGANLSGAYLSGANLSGANLSRANLSGANLSGAYLSGANLSGAYLSGAYLSGATQTALAEAGWTVTPSGLIVKAES